MLIPVEMASIPNRVNKIQTCALTGTETENQYSSPMYRLKEVRDVVR